ncbi:hypothetical protein L596_024772 [Steinernema carpocapsae]|nr:hypothetical protein L596_024772 [Steinernema carpocapsae]
MFSNPNRQLPKGVSAHRCCRALRGSFKRKGSLCFRESTVPLARCLQATSVRKNNGFRVIKEGAKQIRRVEEGK